MHSALFIWSLFLVGFVNAQDDEDTSSDAAFAWTTVPNMISCTPATVTWQFGTATTDADHDMVIAITNFGVPQLPALSITTEGQFTTHAVRGLGGSVRTRKRRELTEDISDTIRASAHVYTWPQVVVPSGWYALVAKFPPTTEIRTSATFYVDGTDMSCMGGSTSSASTPTDSGTTASTPAPTSSGDPSASSGVVLPADGGSSSSSSSKVNRGAIAGGVIGGLAVIAAAIAAYIYLRYAAASSGRRKKTTRNWTGLTSTDSKGPSRSYPTATSRTLGGPSSGRHHSQSDSIGPMLSGHDNNVYVIGTVGIESRPSRIDTRLEDDDGDGVASYFSPSQEKFAASSPPIRSPFSDPDPYPDPRHVDDDEVPMDLITPLPGTNVARNSSTSTASGMTHNSRNNFSRPRSHPSSPYASPTATAMESSPFTQNNANANATDSSLGHYPPSSGSGSGSGSPFPGSDNIAAAPRRGSTSASDAPALALAPGRRVARKAVPQYNPNDPTLALAPVPQSESDSTGPGPKLRHQNSFGDGSGKPVHYLIPDMPPPQRD